MALTRAQRAASMRSSPINPRAKDARSRREKRDKASAVASGLSRMSMVPGKLSAGSKSEKGKLSTIPKDDEIAKQEERGFRAPKNRETTNNEIFYPTTVFGEEPEEGLSAVGRADLRISQWESILETHKQNAPSLIPICELQLQRAIAQRNSLDALPTSETIVNPFGRIRAVEDRINDLQTLLSGSKFDPEKVNVQGTIDAYRSGQISYSNDYSLIWAGQIVDKAKTYAEFTTDRQERLDRYAQEYGPHWLWWEPPLWVHPDERVMAAGCQIIERTPSAGGFGQFYISQAFWKRSGWVTRMHEYAGGKLEDPVFPAHPINNGNQTLCQEEGPKLSYRSLLDSGASFPSLYWGDFRDLGIVKNLYGAQSLAKCSTANGLLNTRVYELHVMIASNPGTPLVDPRNPMIPQHPPYVGGLTPCCMIENDTTPDGYPPVNENGHEESIRLSGILPFVAPYVSITPSHNTIILGENRNDVVGARKIPPHRFWMVGLDQNPVSRREWDRLGDPMIKFTHRGGALIDEDIGPTRTRMTANPGTQNEHSEIYDARTAYAQ